MATTKIKIDDYVGLSLSVMIISAIAMFVAMYLGDVHNEIHRDLVLSLWGIFFLAIACCFALVIYRQFKDKRTWWAIANIILLIGFLSYRGVEGSDAAIILFIMASLSCGYYYHKYKSHFKIKRK